MAEIVTWTGARGATGVARSDRRTGARRRHRGDSGCLAARTEERDGLGSGAGAGRRGRAATPRGRRGVAGHEGGPVQRGPRRDAFANGGRELELGWQPAGWYAGFVDDSRRSADLETTAPVPGGVAKLFRYEGTNDFTAIWFLGGSVLDARGLAPSVDEFRTTLASMHEVDVDTWLSAMPESVVKPAARAEVVEEMLSDIPLPPGFDAAALRKGDAVRDRYQLGARVAGAVACAWIDRWVEARRAGNASAAATAAEAIGGSRGWPVLHEMKELGDYPSALAVRGCDRG